MSGSSSDRAASRAVLGRTIHADATDPDCALVVLTARSTAALNALSNVPRDRTVSYLDLERPEFGVNPLASTADVAVAAERLTAVLTDGCRDEAAGDASARYLDHAARAVIGAGRAGVIEGLPTIWDMYRILIPAEAGFRGRVVESLYLDPALVETAVWLGRELERDLERSPRTTAAVLDHARNSILRLVTEPLDQVLRHPDQLDLGEFLHQRGVLIVDGRAATVGTANARAILWFVANALRDAFELHLSSGETRRTRVALKVDAAHLLANEGFADVLEQMSSAGIEVVAALGDPPATETDRTLIAHHVSAQRERGGAVPATLPDPLPKFSGESGSRLD